MSNVCSDPLEEARALIAAAAAALDRLATEESFGVKAGDLLKRKMVVYADGACSGNPGPAAVAYAITVIPLDMPVGDVRHSKLVKVDRPSEVQPGGMYLIHSMSQKLKGECGSGKAEVVAATYGLINACNMIRMLDVDAVELVSDSQYVVGAVNGWLNGWVRKGWRKSNGDPVANRDVWEWYLAKTTPEFRGRVKATYKSISQAMMIDWCDDQATKEIGSKRNR